MSASQSTSDGAHKRPASPSLLEPPARRRHNSATGSNRIEPTRAVSAAEHKDRVGAFADSGLESLIRQYNRVYVRDVMDLEKTVGISDGELWEALSFIHDIWSRQVAGARELANYLREMGDQAAMPSSAAWYRRWLDNNSPQHLLAVPKPPRLREARLTASSLASFVRQQEQQAYQQGHLTPDQHSARVQNMAGKLKCCLEETVIRHFHTQIIQAKNRGQELDKFHAEDKTPDEGAIQCLRRRWLAVSVLVDEFRVRCMGNPEELHVDRLHAWLEAQQHLKVSDLRWLITRFSPTEGIMHVTEEADDDGGNTLLAAAGANACRCSSQMHTWRSKKPKYPCRVMCLCFRSALECAPERCDCPCLLDASGNCGNPFNNLERLFGPAVTPIAVSDCFKDWLKERNVLKKPLELTELFGILNAELTQVTASDSVLDDWRATWADLETRPQNSSARRAHMQLLVRIAAAKEYPGRGCLFSFCLLEAERPLESGAWLQPGGHFRGHCSRCLPARCQVAGTWHCSKCGECWGRERGSPCFKCGGVPMGYLEFLRGAPEPSDDGN